MPPTTTVIGAGRAGSAFASALSDAEWNVHLVHHQDAPDPGSAELVLVCVPDGEVERCAAQVPTREDRVVAHCAGSLSLEVLAPHDRRASVHPLTSIPRPPTGARRIRGAWFAIAGSSAGEVELMSELVAELEGRSFEVSDSDRTRYHAACAIASNHTVALLGQVERLAAEVGVPMEAYLDLVRSSVDNVAELGAAEALTGPVARGDWDTIARHIESLPEEEVATYSALAAEALRLATEWERPENRPPRDPLGLRALLNRPSPFSE